MLVDRFGRWLLFTVTIICWGAQFASMSLTSTIQNSVCANRSFSLITTLAGPNRWQAAMALYMIGFISYGATLVFYAALFPRLARNTQHARDLREKYENGEVPPEVYEIEESMEKNRISNISTVGIFNALSLVAKRRILIHVLDA
jgi:Vacuole effluxer Atg22 like